MDTPNYYAIIPAHVRYDENLCANAKLLYGEITALSNKEGYCWSTNDYFAKLYKVSKVSVSKWINKLVSKGYLFSNIIRDKNTKQILERRLYIADPSLIPHKEKFKRGNKEKFKRGNKEKFKDNTTSVNTTSNNIYSNEKIFLENESVQNAPSESNEQEISRTNFLVTKEERKKPPTFDEVENFIAENNIQINTREFYDYYHTNDWIDSQGKKVRNWQQKVRLWQKNDFGKAKAIEPVKVKRPDSKIYVAPTENSCEQINISRGLMLLQAAAIRDKKCSASEVINLSEDALKAKFNRMELFTLGFK